uniref:adenine phosphoribosyltransferase n=1 Tax=Nelumbo nucifera TaxID=4432 RepID=A0A822XRE6_NELNU|nr:TPA_asm: hypothetical protein HUJ06_024055 [Nelumbo nucifera]
MFQDITTLLLHHRAFKDTVDIFVDRYRDMDISVVAGIGWSLALPLLHHHRHTLLSILVTWVPLPHC